MSYNLYFNPERLEAYSSVPSVYGRPQWKFLHKTKDGKIIFNTYPQTGVILEHQEKVRKLMSDLGITIDLELSYTYLSLDDNGVLENEIRETKIEIKERENSINVLESWPSLNKMRQTEIKILENHIRKVQDYIK